LLGATDQFDGAVVGAFAFGLELPDPAAVEQPRADPALAAVIAAADGADVFAWERALPWRSPFEALVRAIAGQQISMAAAAAI